MFGSPPVEPLPELQDRSPLAADQIARFASPSLVLERPSEVTVTFEGGLAWFRNTLGVYEVAPDGSLGPAAIVIESTRPGSGDAPLAPGDSFDLGSLFDVETFPAGTRFGLFVIADGARLNPDELWDEGSLVFSDGGAPATVASAVPDLVHVAGDGSITPVAGKILHAAGDDALSLNEGGAVQAVAGAPPAGDGLIVAFEDRVGTFADRDYQDLVIRVTADAVSLPDLDVLAGNTAGNVLLENEGGGPPPVLTASPLAGGIATTLDIALGDLDGDGDLDAVLANIGANQLLLNDGAGGFTASELPGGGANSRGIALGDLDGDGDLDAFVANDRSGDDQVLVNLGDGDGDGVTEFAAVGLRRTDDQLNQDVALGDLDGDGDLDAMTAVSGGGNRVMLNQGDLDGDGDLEFARGVVAGGQRTSNGIALGDLDGDGDLDAIVANGSSSGAAANQLLLNLGDQDGDGIPDFAASNLPGGIGNGTAVALADFDADGDLDAVLTRAFSFDDPGEDLLLLNLGDQDLDGVPEFGVSALPGGAGDSRALAVGDLDGDGSVDILVTGRDEDRLLLNLGSAAPDEAPAFAVTELEDNGNGRALAVGDVDGDGTVPVTDLAGLPDLGTLVPSPGSDVPVA